MTPDFSSADHFVVRALRRAFAPPPKDGRRVSRARRLAMGQGPGREAVPDQRTLVLKFRRRGSCDATRV